jgi:MerR family transcriptional regulator, Zn(II)-responsive regulator of zntA
VNEADLTSGDLARATGSTLRAIRFYEQQGLLAPAVVSDGGHRRYTADDLERLRLIGDLRELGLSLSEIRSALELRTGCAGGAELAQRFQELLLGHIAQAERRLERLRRVKRELEAALGTVQKRLTCAEASCPCEVQEASTSARIVKLVAQGSLCAPPGDELT